MVHLSAGELHAGIAPKTDSFRKSTTSFRDRVSAVPGAPHPPEAGRYHLVVALACPFAHRTLIMRSLRGLQNAVSVDIVNPELTKEHGWSFSAVGPSGREYAECGRERSGLNAQHLYQLYQHANPSFTGTITVPVLWDKKQHTIVNNDSGEIMEMLNSEFDSLRQDESCPDLYPTELQSQIDNLNNFLSGKVNIGVYKCAFSKSQGEYNKVCVELFQALDTLEQRLATQRYLINYFPPGSVSPSPTLADYRLFTTLIRFDVIYYPLMKANIRHIRDYPNLQGYMEDLYSTPAVASTVNFDHIRIGYWLSFVTHGLNPKERIAMNGEPFLPKGAFKRRALGLPENTPQADQQADTEDPQGGKDKAQPGAFVRGESRHRNWIKADGSSQFKPEKGRYHLYVANNCPWCHRAVLARALLGMQDSISTDVLYYRRDPDRGWQFKPDEPGCTADSAAGGIAFIRELYEREESQEKSVPVLYDKQTKMIVSNESADIVRMFATECQAMHAAEAPNLIPTNAPQLRELEAINSWVYNDVANGAYKAGFAFKQQAYETAYRAFFVALDRLELLLSKRKFLLGDQVTEADVRLFPPIFRFDHVYYLRFLLDRAMIVESYPNVQRWMMDFYSLPGVAEASSIDHCKKGYFGRHGNNIVPLGPQLSYQFKQ